MIFVFLVFLYNYELWIIYEISGSAIDPTLIEIENWAFYNSFSNLNFKNKNEDKKINKNILVCIVSMLFNS